MDREHDEDLLGGVLNWKWGRNVGKTPGPQTALGCAIAALRLNRPAKRQRKRQAQPRANREATEKRRRQFCLHALRSSEGPKWSPLLNLKFVPHASLSNEAAKSGRRLGWPPWKRVAKLG